jgi:DNA end-binding protein Ku
MATLDAETEKEVSRRELVKGYEFEKDRYVLMEDADFEQARIDSSSVLNITKFIEAGSIEPIFYDTAYYIVPDGDSGLDVFVVLREALRHARVAALSRVVLTQREHPVAILPSGKGLVCYTLHQPADLWNPAPAYEDLPTELPDASMVDLAEQLINRQRGRFQAEDAEDRYEAKLREVIEAKLRGEGVAPEPEPPPAGGNVVDLMAALKASLQQNQPPAKGKPVPAAKARPAKPAPAKRKAPASRSRKRA